MIDLAIPLGSGSRSGNDELKILLRSIEKNFGYCALVTGFLVVVFTLISHPRRRSPAGGSRCLPAWTLHSRR